jgi:hypothetical protein
MVAGPIVFICNNCVRDAAVVVEDNETRRSVDLLTDIEIDLRTLSPKECARRGIRHSSKDDHTEIERVPYDLAESYRAACRPNGAQTWCGAPQTPEAQGTSKGGVRSEDINRLHALCVAAILGKYWSETDMFAGSEVVDEGLVEFVDTSRPRLTDDGYAALQAAVEGMKGVVNHAYPVSSHKSLGGPRI